MLVRLPLLVALFALSGPAFAVPRPRPAPIHPAPHLPHVPLRPHAPI
jgi:hypothetical protein